MSATDTPDRDELALARHNLREMHVQAEEFRRRNRELAALLDAHQEIGRLQGNRLDAAERALGETQALLRATQGEVQRLTTLLNGFSPRS